MQQHIIGQSGENDAVKYLIRDGYKIIETNYNSRYGEIDIICFKKSTIVFVEVKAKNNLFAGHPETMITCTKLKCLQKTIADFCRRKKIDDKYDLRFDVIAVTQKEIRHWINACEF